MEKEESTAAVATQRSEGMIGWVESMIVTMSQTSVGLSFFRLIDSFLWVVEKSAQWSLPSHEISAEENGKVFGKIELVRPLPWILFLPSLIILRMIRGGLNVGAFILGYPQIQPSGMVKIVQKGRRRLRALNLKAVKSSRRKTCNKAITPDQNSTTESAGSPMHTEPKRKFSKVSMDSDSTDESENESLPSKINRYASIDSTQDSDFNPADCTSESSSSSSADEVEKIVSLSELEDVKKQAEEMLNELKERSNERPVNKETSDQETKEEMAMGVDRVDSPESQTQADKHVSNDFINGEKNSCLTETSPAVTAAPPPPPPPTPKQEVTNGVATEKRHQKPNQKPNVPAHPRGSNSKDQAPHHQDKKSSPRKKTGRYNTK
nr:altered inheritance of mitochondria protein 21-like isoform X3 [Nomia melanderi]